MSHSVVRVDEHPPPRGSRDQRWPRTQCRGVHRQPQLLRRWQHHKSGVLLGVHGCTRRIVWWNSHVHAEQRTSVWRFGQLPHSVRRLQDPVLLRLRYVTEVIYKPVIVWNGHCYHVLVVYFFKIHCALGLLYPTDTLTCQFSRWLPCKKIFKFFTIKEFI